MAFDGLIDVGRLADYNGALVGELDARYARPAAMTASELAEGASTEARAVSAAVLAGYVSGKVDEALGVVANGSY